MFKRGSAEIALLVFIPFTELAFDLFCIFNGLGLVILSTVKDTPGLLRLYAPIGQYDLEAILICFDRSDLFADVIVQIKEQNCLIFLPAQDGLDPVRVFPVPAGDLVQDVTERLRTDAAASSLVVDPAYCIGILFITGNLPARDEGFVFQVGQFGREGSYLTTADSASFVFSFHACMAVMCP